MLLYHIGILTVVPTTQNVWINETATFKCATNISKYSLKLSIPFSIQHMHANTSVVHLPGGGQLATVNIILLEMYNGTNCTCVLQNINGILNPIAWAFGYAQGKVINKITAIIM